MIFSSFNITGRGFGYIINKWLILDMIRDFVRVILQIAVKLHFSHYSINKYILF